MQINKSIVTGATGFIGRKLAAQLQELGASVLAVSRGRQDGPWEEFVEQDFNEPLGISLSTFDKVDCIFHLAGIAHAESGIFKWEDYYKVNTQATIDLLEAAGQAGAKKFIFVSSIKASSDPGEECVDESWVKDPSDDYGISKLLAEQAVIEISEKYSMDYVIIRPTLVYGPNIKGNLLKMINVIEKGRFPPIPKIANKRSLIHVDDLCRAIILAATKPEAVGNTYIVSDLKQYSTREIYEAIMKGLDKRVAKLFIPTFCFIFMAKIGDVLEKILNRKMPLNSVAIDKLFGSACYDARKIKYHLGFNPTWTLDSAMPRIIESYRKSIYR